MNKNQKYVAVALGHNQVALINYPEKRDSNNPFQLNGLKIMESASMDDGGYQPAESVILSGEAILRLRDALNEAFPPEVKFDVVKALKESGGCAKFYHGFDSSAVCRTDKELIEAQEVMKKIGKVFHSEGFRVEVVDGLTLQVDQGEDK